MLKKYLTNMNECSRTHHRTFTNAIERTRQLFVFVHLTNQTEFLVHVRSLTKRTNVNKLPTERFTNVTFSSFTALLISTVDLQDYTTKLSDFGLAKAGPQGDETHVSTRVMGTYGYAAPEYVMTGHLTARSDVYSFGVVLLELLTGKKSVDKTRPSKEQSLVDWARPKLNDKRKSLQIIDPRLESQYSVRGAQKACSLAYYCLSQNPKARPLMSDVVETLEPLQTSSSCANEVSLSSSLMSVGRPLVTGNPAYQMHHKFVQNVGAGAGCRSANPNCSPGPVPACRVG
ncbi:putative protein kinase RLK-Pelle-RLCK-VIIa-2 family [Helianthus annuus]|nr:putative protein kinase RLK-Pelle-RLCK-VIIa-2 family [Helianthus annuus]